MLRKKKSHLTPKQQGIIAIILIAALIVAIPLAVSPAPSSTPSTPPSTIASPTPVPPIPYASSLTTTDYAAILIGIAAITAAAVYYRINRKT